MASTSQTNPAYDVPLFNARDCLVHLHQEITNFLHYQSHIREQETIIEFLKEEHACIKTLRQLLEMADNNSAELHSLFEDSPVNNDVNWGEVTWGPMPQWELPPLQDE